MIQNLSRFVSKILPDCEPGSTIGILLGKDKKNLSCWKNFVGNFLFLTISPHTTSPRRPSCTLFQDLVTPRRTADAAGPAVSTTQCIELPQSDWADWPSITLPHSHYTVSTLQAGGSPLGPPRAGAEQCWSSPILY